MNNFEFAPSGPSSTELIAIHNARNHAFKYERQLDDWGTPNLCVITGKCLETKTYIKFSKDGNYSTFGDYCINGSEKLYSIPNDYLVKYLTRQNLGLAAFRGDITEIKHIINLGIFDINKRDEDDELPTQQRTTSLAYAVFCKDLNNGFLAFKLLVDAGADFKLTTDYKSLLWHAAENQNIEIIKLLICKGAEIPELSRAGRSKVNEAVNQLFNKYKQLLIAEKDDHSSLNCFPREILSYISILSTRITYEKEKETPIKKIEEKSFIDEVEECFVKVKESTCSIQ